VSQVTYQALLAALGVWTLRVGVDNWVQDSLSGAEFPQRDQFCPSLRFILQFFKIHQFNLRDLTLWSPRLVSVWHAQMPCILVHMAQAVLLAAAG